MVEKAATLAADHVFFDLEDATPPAEKEAARRTVVDALTNVDYGDRVVAVRINDVRTRWAYRDVVDVVSGAGTRLDCVLIPKVADASDVHFVDKLLAGVELDMGLTRPIGIELLVETASGAANIGEISRASPRIEAIVFGPGDYSLDLGVLRFEIGTRDPAYPGHQWHWAMSAVANHARAIGARAIDGPSVDYTDEEGYRTLARMAKALGFDGKWCIHPRQIPWANETFSVSADEVSRARALLASYEEARAGGRGAAVFDGIMVDDATRKMAERVLERAAEDQSGGSRS